MPEVCPVLCPQVRCSALPQSLLHQAVVHPLKLLQMPFHKLERQLLEAKAAQQACPMASACGCQVRKSARLARHIAHCHSPQLLGLSEMVAKKAQVNADVSKSERVGHSENSCASDLNTGSGQVAMSFNCPFCAMTASLSQTGLPSIHDWGYVRQAAKTSTSSCVTAADKPMQSVVHGATRKNFSTFIELSEHIKMEHEGQIVCLGAYISGLGGGFEGTPCPLAAPSIDVEIHQRGGLARHSHGNYQQAQVKRVGGRYGIHDLVSCPGGGRFVFDSVEGLLQHSVATHMDHLIQVGNTTEGH